MTSADAISKMFTFPNIFFTVAPFMVMFALLFYKLGSGKSIDSKYMWAANAFGYGCLFMHIMKDLDDGDDESGMIAGLVGYAISAFVLFGHIFLSKRSSENVSRIVGRQV